MTHFYTGVGSRETPQVILDRMAAGAAKLAIAGYVLRSGGADGADTAFENGSDGIAHIYLPWPGFNGRQSVRDRPCERAFELAATIHPAWSHLSAGARALHARNCHQVLGDDLSTPSDFLVCWTPDGCERETDRTRATGGTATAIVLADRHHIPVFNLRNERALARLISFLEANKVG